MFEIRTLLVQLQQRAPGGQCSSGAVKIKGKFNKQFPHRTDQDIRGLDREK